VDLRGNEIIITTVLWFCHKCRSVGDQTLRGLWRLEAIHGDMPGAAAAGDRVLEGIALPHERGYRIPPGSVCLSVHPGLPHREDTCIVLPTGVMGVSRTSRPRHAGPVPERPERPVPPVPPEDRRIGGVLRPGAESRHRAPAPVSGPLSVHDAPTVTAMPAYRDNGQHGR
jgi:hypothetical protein